MSKRLKSVGLDVGTTSTQMVVSELEIENQAGSFSVPKMEIVGRRVCYKSPVYFTPLLDESHVDGAALKEIVEAEYVAAGLTRQQVDTGAVIITGETSRKENAEAVLSALAELAGDFVVTTAGPDLESVLSARGAGAVRYSKQSEKPVLHMDIGGGTSNLSLLQEGEFVQTGCLNVGGRLLKLDGAEKVIYVSPVLKNICAIKPGDRPGREALEAVADTLVQALEMAAGLRTPTKLLAELTTENTHWEIPKESVILSFSGGVADCIENTHEALKFGDIGPILGQKIRNSRLCAGEFRLGEETIRATVIGAGCHSAQLSGSTVFQKNVAFPMKNIPVLCLPQTCWELPEEDLAAQLRVKEKRWDTPPLLYLSGKMPEDYSLLKALAKKLSALSLDGQALVAVQSDAAKALGQAMAMCLPPDASCLCLDGVYFEQGSYLDVGQPVGPAIPVVVKTLVFEK